MSKIDWTKPIRGLHSNLPYQLTDYRVVKVGDGLFIVTEEGKFPLGEKVIENVPEEKFFLGLYRVGESYGITDCGQPTTMSVLEGWKRSYLSHEPNWIVDIRNSAEPPKAVVHDPKDWAVIFYGDEDDSVACEYHLMTKTEAEAKLGGTAVRVRTTPAPVDTSRYVLLYRPKDSNDNWKIVMRGFKSQELQWDEIRNWKFNRSNLNFVAVKVRD